MEMTICLQLWCSQISMNLGIIVSHVVSFIWRLLFPLCLVNANHSFSLCLLTLKNLPWSIYNILYISVPEALCAYPQHRIYTAFTWLFFGRVFVFVFFFYIPCWSEHLHYIVNAQNYYFSEWECYYFHCNITIIRWYLLFKI